MQADLQSLPDDADLVEWYYAQGFSDGLAVVPPTPAAVEAMPGVVAVLLGKEDLR